MNRIIFEQSEVTPDGRVTFGGTRAEHVLAVLHGVVGQTLKTGVVDGSIGTSTIEEIAPLPPDPATGLPQGRITVRVYTILGQMVSQATLQAGTSELRLGTRGIYLVRIGNLTQKVAI